ncbi:MAG TPA: STAS domain-containing protein [Herpetosiphonaceae bacterium]
MTTLFPADAAVSLFEETPWRPGLLQAFLAAMEGGFLIVDPSSQAVCNKRFLEIWNIPPALAGNCPSMLRHIVDQLVDPDQFEHQLHAVSSDPTTIVRDEVVLNDGRVIARCSQPSRDGRGDPYRVWFFYDVTHQKQAAERLRQQQAQIIQQQQAALAELSTPLIPISDDVLVMPLIGAVDTNRAQQILETLLEGVSQRRPRVVILDITGVAIVDTQVANALVQAAQAVQLLGSQVRLTGIRPNIAETLVTLGVSFRGITTHGTLQDAISATLAAGR